MSEMYEARCFFHREIATHRVAVNHASNSLNNATNVMVVIDGIGTNNVFHKLEFRPSSGGSGKVTHSPTFTIKVSNHILKCWFLLVPNGARYT